MFAGRDRVDTFQFCVCLCVCVCVRACEFLAQNNLLFVKTAIVCTDLVLKGKLLN